MGVFHCFSAVFQTTHRSKGYLIMKRVITSGFYPLRVGVCFVNACNQLLFSFIHHRLICQSFSHLAFQMSETEEKLWSRLSKAHNSISLCPNQQFKTQGTSVYYHRGLKKPENTHIWEPGRIHQRADFLRNGSECQPSFESKVKTQIFWALSHLFVWSKL